MTKSARRVEREATNKRIIIFPLPTAARYPKRMRVIDSGMGITCPLATMTRKRPEGERCDR